MLMIAIQNLYSQYPNIQVSNPNNSDPNEVAITINPVNPMNLAAGANINYYYYSTNGGLTWSQGSLTSSLTVWGDPVLIFDNNGHLYFGHLTNPSGPAFIDRIVVQKSTNGGVSWNDGVGIGLNLPKQQDKEWLAADMSNSSYRHNIYMAWTEFDSYGSANPLDSTRILFSRTTDAGQTWSSPVKVSDAGGDCIDEDNTVEGAVPAVGPNGEVYTAWSGPLGIMLDRSLDGGVTFGQDIFVTSQPGGWDFPVSGIYRSNGLPVTACDISNSPYNGHVYVLWADQRNGASNTDVFIIKSTDGGDTWGIPVRVNNDNSNRHQFFPWMTIDQSTGYIYVVFYDRRNTTGDATEVWLAKSTDGGNSFSNFRISQSAFTPNQQVFFGDYNGIAAMNGKVYPIWTRMVSSSRSVWMAIVNDNPVVWHALRDTVLAKSMGRVFVNKLSSVFFDNDNLSLAFSIENLSSGITGDISNDSLYLMISDNFTGSVDLKVTAKDGRLSVSDTFSVMINEFNSAQISLGALASPVVNIIRFAVGADSNLSSVNITVNFHPLTVQKYGYLYFGDYEIVTPGNLSVHTSVTDAHAFQVSLDRSYQVSVLNKYFTFGDYKIRGAGEGYLLTAKSNPIPISKDWILLGSGIDLLSTGQVNGMEIEMNYMNSISRLPPGADESKIGIYQWANGEWMYAGGEGHDGMVSANLLNALSIAVIYNPDHEAAPKEFLLLQNYPNPFNPSTRIRYEVSSESRVSLRIYNMLGQEVRSLVNTVKGVGRYEVDWDGTNDLGQPVASGLYIYRLNAGKISKARKMLFVK